MWIVVDVESGLQTTYPGRMRDDAKVDRLRIVVIDFVLCRFSVKYVAATVSYFSDVAEPKFSCRNLAVGGDSYFLQWQESIIIVKPKHQRSPDSGFQPFAVMICGVVIAEIRVVAADPEVEIIAEPVLKLQSLQVRFDKVVAKRYDDQLSQRRDAIGEPRRHEHVE